MNYCQSKDQFIKSNAYSETQIKKCYKLIKHLSNGRIVKLHDYNNQVGRKYQNDSVDFSFISNSGSEEKIEAKFRTIDWGDIIFETQSCSVEGRENKGWGEKGKCDKLWYGVPLKSNDILLYIVDFKLMQKAFYENKDKLVKKSTDQINKTEFYPIPLSYLKDAILNKYEIYEDKSFKCVYVKAHSQKSLMQILKQA